MIPRPLLAAFLLALPSQAAGPVAGSENPVDFSYPYFDGEKEISISEVRDPAVIRVGDTWYLTFTHFPFTHSDSADASKPDDNSSPGIRLYSSKDLNHWKFVNWLVKSNELPDDSPYKHRFWAPEIHRIGGRFYLIFTSDNWLDDKFNKSGKIGNYVAFVGEADQVTGPYENIRWLEGAGCDTSLFEDNDGKTYAIMPFGDEFIQQVDLKEMKLVGARTRIVNRDNSDVGKTNSPDYLEGPWMIQRDDKYILFTAAPYKDNEGELKSGYWTGMAVADHILGPYRKQPRYFPGGHVAVFDGPDHQPWFSYRGEAGAKTTGRLNLRSIPFNPDGTPALVNTGMAPEPR